MRIPIILAAAVLFLPQIALADAAKHEERSSRLFEKYDTNNDGQVTKDEIEVIRHARRKEADKDGNGEISKAEFLAVAEKNRKERIEKRLARMKQRMEERGAYMAEVAFNRRDTNGDGKLSAAELAESKRMAIFNCMDLNKDGAVTVQESRDSKCSFRGHSRPRG